MTMTLSALSVVSGFNLEVFLSKPPPMPLLLLEDLVQPKSKKSFFQSFRSQHDENEDDDDLLDRLFSDHPNYLLGKERSRLAKKMFSQWKIQDFETIQTPPGFQAVQPAVADEDDISCFEFKLDPTVPEFKFSGMKELLTHGKNAEQPVESCDSTAASTTSASSTDDSDSISVPEDDDNQPESTPTPTPTKDSLLHFQLRRDMWRAATLDRKTMRPLLPMTPMSKIVIPQQQAVKDAPVKRPSSLQLALSSPPSMSSLQRALLASKKEQAYQTLLAATKHTRRGGKRNKPSIA
jgi:hypothetical protein